MSGAPDPTGAADLVAAIVERAALDGSTCVPAAVVAAALLAHGVDPPGPAAEAARDAGRVVAYPEDQTFGHPRWAPLEEQLAEALVDLVSSGGAEAVTVVETPRGAAPPEESAGTVVVADAHRLGLDDTQQVMQRLAGADTRLLLAGDPAMPYAPGPGRLLADLVSSGAVPVRAAEPAGSAPLDRLVAGLRRGELPVVDPEQREVVVTPAADPADAVRRCVQLVTASLPDRLGIAAADTVVVSPRPDGATGTTALRTALEAAGVDAVRISTGTEPADAVVLVLPAEAAGSMSRALLVAAATDAARHLSIVHQAGPALAAAVADRPHPPRRTRLAGLLADALG